MARSPTALSLRTNASVYLQSQVVERAWQPPSNCPLGAAGPVEYRRTHVEEIHPLFDCRSLPRILFSAGSAQSPSRHRPDLGVRHVQNTAAVRPADRDPT